MVRRLLALAGLASAAGVSACAARQASATAAAIEPAADRASALASLIAAERGFATLARDSGIWVAFRTNMGDSSLLFRPGPVNGHQWMLDHPNPDRTALLRWEPRFADVSRSGDFGWTTGPSTFQRGGATDTAISHGTFLSLWRRSPGRPWRVHFDGGAGESPWTLPAGGWSSDVFSPAPASAGYPAGPSATASLLAVDSALGRADRDGGAWDALLARLEDDGRVYRQDRTLLIGRGDARAALGGWAGRFTSAPRGSEMASSGDLAFTWGAYEAQAEGAPAPTNGYYVRFWRRAPDGAWRIAFDALYPAPPRLPAS